MDLKDIEHIISLLKANDISDFELEHDGTHIKLSRGSRATMQAKNQLITELEPAITGNHAGNSNVVPVAPQYDASLVKVESPIVGTFYRRPRPDADAFTKEGSQVKKGDTLCIVEAMKLMNEIEAPCSGKVEKILLNDGQVAEFGEVLFLINPNA